MTTETTLAETRSTDPLAIIAGAIERGQTDADTIGKLMDLVERVEKRKAVIAFSEAMRQCQAEMPAVFKTKRNAFLENMYAELDDIVRAAKPVWTKHGFSLSFSEGETAAAGMCRVVCTVRHSVGHIEKHAATYPLDGSGAKGGKNMNPLQGVVSSHSYAQKDLIRQVFMLVIAGMDKDGSGAEATDTLLAAEVEELRKLLRDRGRDEIAFLRDFAKVEAFDQLLRADFEKWKFSIIHLSKRPAPKTGGP